MVKTEKGETQEAAEYKYQEQYRQWQAVGIRCKLVCDSQETVGSPNGTPANTDPNMKPVIHTVHNWMYDVLDSGWSPF